jgi:hypothetical protein
MPDVSEPTPPPIHRDTRIDQIGFAKELQEQYIDDLKRDVKISLMELNIVVADGEFFSALLTTPNKGETDTKKFYKLVRLGLISEKQFLDCVTVVRTAAGKILAKPVLEKMTTWTPGAPSLSVKRKIGVDVALVQALTALSSCSAEKK